MQVKNKAPCRNYGKKFRWEIKKSPQCGQTSLDSRHLLAGPSVPWSQKCMCLKCKIVKGLNIWGAHWLPVPYPIHTLGDREDNGWPKRKRNGQWTWLNIKICHSHLPDPGRGVDRCAFSRPEWSSRTGERWTGCRHSLTWWQSAEKGKKLPQQNNSAINHFCK